MSWGKKLVQVRRLFVFVNNLFVFIFGCTGSSVLCGGLSLVCGERGLLSGEGHKLLLAVASFVVEHRLYARGLSSCGLQALERRLSSYGVWT